MKKLLLGLTLSVALFSCKDKAAESTTAQNTSTSSTLANAATTTNNSTTDKAALQPTSVVDAFKAMRDAIYNKDKEKIASYFDFPIQNAELFWSLSSKNPKATMTKEEFLANIDKIFDDLFIKALLKVKSEELFSKGKFTTEKISVTQKNVAPGSTTETVTQIDANYNKAANTLQLINHLEEGDGESSLIFDFKSTDGKIKFVKFNMAG